jgi:hypothetical protein
MYSLAAVYSAVATPVTVDGRLPSQLTAAAHHSCHTHEHACTRAHARTHAPGGPKGNPRRRAGLPRRTTPPQAALKAPPAPPRLHWGMGAPPRRRHDGRAGAGAGGQLPGAGGAARLVRPALAARRALLRPGEPPPPPVHTHTPVHARLARLEGRTAQAFLSPRFGGIDVWRALPARSPPACWALPMHTFGAVKGGPDRYRPLSFLKCRPLCSSLAHFFPVLRRGAAGPGGAGRGG